MDKEEFKAGDIVEPKALKLRIEIIEVMDSGTLRLKWPSGFETLSDPNAFEKVADGTD